MKIRVGRKDLAKSSVRSNYGHAGVRSCSWCGEAIREGETYWYKSTFVCTDVGEGIRLGGTRRFHDRCWPFVPEGEWFEEA